MSIASSHNTYYLLDSSTKSLVDFFAKATSIMDEDFFRAKQECVIARYALRDKMAVYSALKESIQTMMEAEPEKALLLLNKLDLQAEKLIGTTDRLVKLLKTAAEIEILSSTKFDGVQLFHIVQQIPVIVSEIITSCAVTILETFLDDILSAVENSGIELDGQKMTLYRQAKQEIPVVAASFAKTVGERLSDELEKKLKVLEANNSAVDSDTVNQQVEANARVTEDTVRAMINTVPNADN